MGDLFESWIARRLALLERGEIRSARDEETRIRRHALPMLGEVALDEVAHRHVRALMDELRGSGLAPRTQLHVYSTLSAGGLRVVEGGAA